MRFPVLFKRQRRQKDCAEWTTQSIDKKSFEAQLTEVVTFWKDCTWDVHLPTSPYFRAGTTVQAGYPTLTVLLAHLADLAKDPTDRTQLRREFGYQVELEKGQLLDDFWGDLPLTGKYRTDIFAQVASALDTLMIAYLKEYNPTLKRALLYPLSDIIELTNLLVNGKSLTENSTP